MAQAVADQQAKMGHAFWSHFFGKALEDKARLPLASSLLLAMTRNGDPLGVRAAADELGMGKAVEMVIKATGYRTVPRETFPEGADSVRIAPTEKGPVVVIYYPSKEGGEKWDIRERLPEDSPLWFASK